MTPRKKLCDSTVSDLSFLQCYELMINSESMLFQWQICKSLY